jgi:hypothetical protein
MCVEVAKVLSVVLALATQALQQSIGSILYSVIEHKGPRQGTAHKTLETITNIVSETNDEIFDRVNSAM